MQTPTPGPLPNISPEMLDRAPVLAESNQGTVRRIEDGGRTFAVKSARGRRTLGAFNRLALAREHAAYARLEGVPGIPRCHGLIGGRLLVLDYIAAAPFRDTPVAESYFDQLLATIRAMHERGVAHGDLKRKANLLVDEKGAPVLLDFGAAVLRKSGFRPLNRRLFEFIRQTDLNAWVKLKYGGYRDVGAIDRPLLRRSAIERWLARFRD